MLGEQVAIFNDFNINCMKRTTQRTIVIVRVEFSNYVKSVLTRNGVPIEILA